MKSMFLGLGMIAALAVCSCAGGAGSLDLIPLPAGTVDSHRAVLTVLQDDAVKNAHSGDRFALRMGAMASINNMTHEQRQAKFVAAYVPLANSYLASRSALQHPGEQEDFYLLTGRDLTAARALEDEAAEVGRETTHARGKPAGSSLQAGLASRPLALTEDGRIKLWTEADFELGMLYDPITKVELGVVSMVRREAPDRARPRRR